MVICAVLPDGSILKDKHWLEMPNFKNSNETFWLIFKQCVGVSKNIFSPFVTVIGCYKNGRHQDCDTIENESRTRDLYLYLFYTKYGKKSCIFRGQAPRFFLLH